MSAVGLLFALLAGAQVSATDWDCDNQMAQVQMNACAAIEFERADAELNRIWPQIVASYRAADREISRETDDRPTGEAVLRQSQRAWIALRDAHCTLEGYGERGGSMEPMVVALCRARLTRERISELNGEGGGE
jgi:uncharacterized protein YecT (DUF1311 family)